ncbi:MAG: hypothetical protein HY806_01860 [Nitrospirae bacterium]|nr:hypothetical protein [Nitrospirota bacterium]
MRADALKKSTTFTKTWLLYKPLFHILLIVIIGLISYSNTFNVPFYLDDVPNIAENPIIKNFQYFTDPSNAKGLPLYTGFKMRFIGYLTFALNYKLHDLDVTGYHIFNISVHIINALLIYWLILLTFQTPWFSVIARRETTKQSPLPEIAPAENRHRNDSRVLFQPSPLILHPSLIAFFSALIFVSHPIQTQAVTYTVQRFTSLATMFYLISLVMYIKSRLRWTIKATVEAKAEVNIFSTLTFYFLSLLSAVLAMKTKEIAFTLPVTIAIYEFMFFNGKIKKKVLYLIPLLLTLFIIPLNIVDLSKNIGNLMDKISDATKVQIVSMTRWDYLFTQFRVIVTYIRLLFLPINQNLDYDYPIYYSLLNPDVFLSFLFLLLAHGLKLVT